MAPAIPHPRYPHVSAQMLRHRVKEVTVKREHLRYLSLDSDLGCTAPATRIQDSHSHIEKVYYRSPLDRAHRIEALVGHFGKLCKAGHTH